MVFIYMRTYYFNKNHNILEARTEGVLRISEIVEHYLDISKTNYPTKDLKILVDCRACMFELRPREVLLTFRAIEKALKKYRTIKESILVKEPFEEDVRTLFRKYNSDIKNYDYKVSYNKEEARKWLD